MAMHGRVYVARHSVGIETLALGAHGVFGMNPRAGYLMDEGERWGIISWRSLQLLSSPATLRIPFGGWFLVMNPKGQMRIISRWFFSVAMVCCLASAASAEWKEQVLYSFQGGTNGAVPIGGIVRDKAGNLYGATLNGGSSSCAGPGQCGVVYELSPPTSSGGSWTETILYVFKGYASGDGATPEGGVIMDSAGNLYGTTGYGGSGPCLLLGSAVGCGTVYELSPPAKAGDPWTETVLYSFQGGNDGYVATGDLVFDKAGNLYGATLFGGGQGTSCDIFYGGQCGTIFELSPPTQKDGQWTEKVLHSFSGLAAGGQYGDGASPNGGLVQDSKGTIYGTTYSGGFNCAHSSNQGCGTVYELQPQNGTWMEKQIHIFKAESDGSLPSAGVVLDSAGSIYGAAQGGTKGCGLVFRLSASDQGSWEGSVIYNFGGNSYYYSPAVSGIDASGSIYGTTSVGPGSYDGSVFRLRQSEGAQGFWNASFLYNFAGGSDAEFINPTLTIDPAGGIYGSSQGGGGEGMCESYCGTVFEIKP
jgi:hypothetical protein